MRVSMRHGVRVAQLYASPSALSLTTIMKSFSALASLACLAVAHPLSSSQDSGQVVLGGLEDHDVNYPGFDLDLTSRRLVQMDGQAPIWMTELEKV